MADSPFDPPPSDTSASSDVPSSAPSESASVSDSSSSPESVENPESVEKEGLQKEIARILTEHGNLESNIGFNHPYWGLQNRLRALNSK